VRFNRYKLTASVDWLLAARSKSLRCNFSGHRPTLFTCATDVFEETASASAFHQVFDNVNDAFYRVAKKKGTT